MTGTRAAATPLPRPCCPPGRSPRAAASTPTAGSWSTSSTSNSAPKGEGRTN